MKTIMKILLCILLVFAAGCGESTPKCEHANTTSNYEISGLSIRKTVTCNDCSAQVSKESVDKIRFMYDKTLVDEQGIKCTLVNVEIDGWGTVTMNFEIEGTGSHKRTFTFEKLYLDGYDANGWIYCSDLSGNRKSTESQWLSDLKAEDFLQNQDHRIEISYQIMDSDSYKILSEKEKKLSPVDLLCS